jgi:hypothetical protein
VTPQKSEASCEGLRDWAFMLDVAAIKRLLEFAAVMTKLEW